MQQTKTTIHLKLPDPRAWWNLPPHVAGAICTFALIAIAALVGRIQSTPVAVNPDPIIIIATAGAIVPIATPMQQAAYVPPAAPRQVVAFAAPDGDVLGPIEAPPLGALVARWGDQWVATMHDGTMVWIRVSELGGSIANLAPQVPQVQPAQQVIYQVVNEAPAQVELAAPTPAPEQAEAPPEPPALQTLAILDRQAWAQQAATQTLPAAIATTTADVQRSGGQPNEAWKQEHCIGSGDQEVCH